ncbi:unnamed protein product, partial [Dovyalis caffra]
METYVSCPIWGTVGMAPGKQEEHGIRFLVVTIPSLDEPSAYYRFRYPNRSPHST